MHTRGTKERATRDGLHGIKLLHAPAAHGATPPPPARFTNRKGFRATKGRDISGQWQGADFLAARRWRYGTVRASAKVARKARQCLENFQSLQGLKLPRIRVRTGGDGGATRIDLFIAHEKQHATQHIYPETPRVVSRTLVHSTHSTQTLTASSDRPETTWPSFPKASRIRILVGTHAAHSTRPQDRQWLRRVVHPNSVLQAMHAFASSSVTQRRGRDGGAAYHTTRTVFTQDNHWI